MKLPPRMRNALLAAVAIMFIIVAVTLWRRDNAELPRVVPVPQGRAPQIDANWHGVLLLAPDGTMWTWGDVPADFGRQTPLPRQIGQDSDWAQIALGNSFCLALKEDGSLWGWGGNNGGALFTASRTMTRTPFRLGLNTNWLRVATGSDHVVALKQDGTLWAWGLNRSGQVGNGTTTNQTAPVQISTNLWVDVACSVFNSFALRQDGTVWGWGYALQDSRHVLTPMQLDDTTNFVAISPGDFHLLALKSDGTLWIRGANVEAVAPTYATGDTANFVQIGTGRDWREIHSGGNSFVARRTDGSWWGSGANRSAQLGLGHRDRAEVPRKLDFDFHAWALAIGGNSTHLLTGDGALWTWGQRFGAPHRAVPLRGLKHRLNRTGFASFRTNDVPQVNVVPKKLWQAPTNGIK